MVGIFSRFSRSGHRRSQTTVGESQVIPPDAAVAGSAASGSHGIETVVEFKPVERPDEPLSNDQPVKCPLPEPSILNDSRIWKERLSASMQRTADLPVVKEGAGIETETSGTKARPSRVSCSSLPSSISAPEYNFMNLLEECKAAGD